MRKSLMRWLPVMFIVMMLAMSWPTTAAQADWATFWLKFNKISEQSTVF